MRYLVITWAVIATCGWAWERWHGVEHEVLMDYEIARLRSLAGEKAPF